MPAPFVTGQLLGMCKLASARQLRLTLEEISNLLGVPLREVWGTIGAIEDQCPADVGCLQVILEYALPDERRAKTRAKREERKKQLEKEEK